MKKMILLLLLISPVATAKNVLKLPYRIVLGETNISEIRASKKCIRYRQGPVYQTSVMQKIYKKFTPTPNKPKPRLCEEFNINNKFYLHIGDNGIINRAEFSTEALPRKWRKLGLKNALPVKETLAILNKAGIKDIEQTSDEMISLKFYLNNDIYTFVHSDGLDSIYVEPDY